MLTAQQNDLEDSKSFYEIMLTISGCLAILLSIIAFQALVKSSKIAWTHNTLHMILMTWGIALVLFSGAILTNTKQLTPLYESFPRVWDLMPNYFPSTLTYCSYFLLFLACLLSVSASWESRYSLIIFCVLAVILLIRFIALVVEINYSSLVLSEEIAQSCSIDILPTLNQDLFKQRLDCSKKYT